MAPEIVRRSGYEGQPVDMWSLGVLLHALLFGCFPFRAKSYPELYRKIAKGTFSVLEDSISTQARDLMVQLLECDPSRRITAGGAIRHPWLQQEYATAQNIRNLRTRTLILVSDRPADDLHPQPLKELSAFGFSKDEITRLVMDRRHCSLTTLYYLLLDTVTRRRKKRPPPVRPVVLDMASKIASEKTLRNSSSSTSIAKPVEQVTKLALVNIHYTATNPLHPLTDRSGQQTRTTSGPVTCREDVSQRATVLSARAGTISNTSASALQVKAARFKQLQCGSTPPINSARGPIRDNLRTLLLPRPSTADKLLQGRPLSDFM